MSSIKHLTTGNVEQLDNKPDAQNQMSVPFKGIAYRLADNWNQHISDDGIKPIKYLEIGTFYGANLFSVAASYGKHPLSELHCIDPWIDYSEYSEYQHEQPKIYATYMENLNASPYKDKIHTHRGFSHNEIPKFEDEYFDIIYIDGNHEPEYVLEDAVLAFRKLKKGGYLIFDDYGWGGPLLTQKGIDGFLSGYHKRIKHIGTRDSQVFVYKLFA
jgi:SAM-dependent methyltransferase